MFEAAESGNSISKEDYESRVPQMRVDLINAQYQLRSQKWPVIILIVGDDWAGCEEACRHSQRVARRALHAHAHPGRTNPGRKRNTHAFGATGELRPPNGTSALFVGGWALNTIAEVVTGTLDEKGYESSHQPHPDHGQSTRGRRRSYPQVLASFTRKKLQKETQADHQRRPGRLGSGRRRLGSLRELRQGTADLRTLHSRHR